MKKFLPFSVLILLLSCNESNNNDIYGNWMIDKYGVSSLAKDPSVNILAIDKLDLKSIFITEKYWGYINNSNDTINKMEYSITKENKEIHLINPKNSNEKAIIEILEMNSMKLNQKDIAFYLVRE